ncbi:MAG: methyl-accepting chemotaxis protein [Desulfobulbaceae bacterium]|nr:methyl-accepting chemotaxis protein [Desulfobulbaceae bacterium]
MSRKTYSRRNYFIKRNMQGLFVFRYFLVGVSGSIIFGLFFAYFAYNSMTITYDDYALQLGETPTILLKQFLLAHWFYLLSGGLLFFLPSLLLSHRVAGPIYKFEKYVDQMNSGRLGEPLHLRSKDEGKELADKIYNLSTMLSDTMAEMKELSREIDQLADTSDTCSTCKKIIARNTNLRTLLERFDTSRE